MSKDLMATISKGNPDEHEVKIDNLVQAQFKNGRLITAMRLENGDFGATVENPPGSGRHERQEILLTEESLAGLIAVIHLLCAHSSYDLQGAIKLATDGESKIEYLFF